VRPEISVVAPLYGNAAAVEELCSRVHGALAGCGHEIVLVSDACPFGSTEAAGRLASADNAIRGLVLERRSGQHVAALTGLAVARAGWRVVMDGDLQDPPEAIPALLEQIRSGCDVVFAARRGRYEEARRLMTSRLFRLTLSLLAGVPRDVGMFFVARADLVSRVLALPVSRPYLVAMVAACATSLERVPVARSIRPSGRSAYRGSDRIRTAATAVMCALQLRVRAPAAGDWRVRFRSL
jgi:polyisoprenyl-phosphate glycosyltransferase